MGGWVITDDESECERVTTTIEPGCCAGINEQATEKCAAKEGRTECERMDQCVFVSREEADCRWLTTNSPSSAPSAESTYSLSQVSFAPSSSPSLKPSASPTEEPWIMEKDEAVEFAEFADPTPLPTFAEWLE